MGTAAVASFASLRNALINVPPKIELALNATNTLAQNVIIQLTWKENGKDKNAYTGWTGVSCRKAIPPVGTRKNDVLPMFDIDPAFAATIGLTEGTRVQLNVHQDCGVAHTVHVEPLTANDWEIMVHVSFVLNLQKELHSNFLELNLVSQIRAVTTIHPITIYLSPTSVATINVTQIEPPPTDPARKPFAILSPQAEVIVAPKVRQPLPVSPETQLDLNGGKNSVASTTKSKRSRRKPADPSIILRTICLPHPVFEDELLDNLCVYVDPQVKALPVFSGGVAKISIIPSPSRQTSTPEKEKEANAVSESEFTVAKQIVVKAQIWEEAPEGHIGLSPQLALTLGLSGLGDFAKYARIEIFD